MTSRHRASGFTIIETLFVVGLIGIVGAIAMPQVGRTLAGFRLSGDARGLANSIAVAKIRAASKFTRVRMYVDLSDDSYVLQVMDKSTVPPSWHTEGGVNRLNYDVDFSFSPVASPPPNSQGAIAQATPCLEDDAVTAIAGTACITFNSRGVPVDAFGVPNADGVFYVSDGTAIYAIAAASTGMIRLWRTFPTVASNWMLQ